MSYLRNPSFENSTSNWKKINHASNVTFNAGPSGNPAPVSGNNIANILSLVNGGSVGQDVTVNATSVSAFAYVTSVTGGVDGALAIWNLSKGVASTSRFTIQNAFTWQLVVNTLDLDGTANADVRVEIYVSTAGAQLSVDTVNLF